MLKGKSSYCDYLYKMYPEEGIEKRRMKDLTFQLTEDCNLRCSYCYQINKTPNKMTFETAKKLIDYIFDNRKDPNFYYYEGKTKGFIIEFIGGEPLLEIDLMEQIMDYFEDKLLTCLENKWYLFHAYNISTNGTLYFNPKFQALMERYSNLLSVGVTVDGSKEQHDSCRCFPNGNGSYDLAEKAMLHQYKRGYENTKITLSPDNIKYLYNGITNLLNKGFHYIYVNCCFEDVWNKESALELFNELIKICDYIKDNDIYDKIYISMLSPYRFDYIAEEGLINNWCGVGNGDMLSLDYNGKLYPCIRFMPSSLGNDIEPIILGDIENGILVDKKHIEDHTKLCNCNRLTLSDKKCLDCSIAQGCSWCLGFSYQTYHNLEQKTNFICDPYKMTALASKYLCKINNDIKMFNKIKLTYEMYKDLIDEKIFNNINKWEE